MAGFTCDICGGTIKMQANKTGVCQSCGMEYDLDAIKAMAGQNAAPQTSVDSAAVHPAENIASVDSYSADALDRRALVCYLGDVRVIETLIAKDQEQIRALPGMGEQLLKKKVASIMEKPLKPSEPSVPEKTNTDKGAEISSWIFGIGLSVVGVIFLICGIPLLGIFCLLMGVFCLIVAFNYLGDSKKYKEKMVIYLKQKSDYDEAVAQFNQNMDVYNELMKSESSHVKSEQSMLENELNEEIRDLNSQLVEAYSLNIIPVQFRNIEGVYYLYDYLSTSHQSLSEALMQANLEAIKQKLDQMIKLQSVQIIQQAQANAKLGKIMEFSEATMNNSAVAAKYAQISAINSALTAKLAAEQLAYQKAEFWLK